MFRKTFQKGFLTVLYAGGSSPLKIWDKMVMNGHIKRLTDEDVRVLVLEMRGTNVATCYIFTPICPKEVLGIRLPFLVMIVKNLKKYFSFEITILDDRHMRRRFRVSNYQTTTKVRPFGTTMPIGLNPGWNQIQFNLADFTKRAYGSSYVETQRIQIHANCRIRRIYFCDKLYSEDDIPSDYRLFYPCTEEVKKEKICQEAEVPPPSVAGDYLSVGTVDDGIITEEMQDEEEAGEGSGDKLEIAQEVEEEPLEGFLRAEDEEPSAAFEESEMKPDEEAVEETGDEVAPAGDEPPSEEQPPAQMDDQSQPTEEPPAD